MTGLIGTGFPRFSVIAEDLFESPAKLFIFFRDAPLLRGHHFYIEISTLQGRRQMFQIVFPEDLSALPVGKFCAIATVLRKGGQPSISASNSSPAWIGPTPAGVPVR